MNLEFFRVARAGEESIPSLMLLSVGNISLHDLLHMSDVKYEKIRRILELYYPLYRSVGTNWMNHSPHVCKIHHELTTAEQSLGCWCGCERGPFDTCICNCRSYIAYMIHVSERDYQYQYRGTDTIWDLLLIESRYFGESRPGLKVRYVQELDEDPFPELF